MCARPPARHRAAVDVDHQPVISGVAQTVEVVRDHVLLVALDEVHFEARHAEAAEPRQFAEPHRARQQPVARCLGDLVVRAAGVVPEEDVHALPSRVPDQVEDRLFLHVVPVRVHEEILPAHLRSEVDELAHAVGVARAVGLAPPAPRDASWADPRGERPRARRREVIHERGFDDRAGRLADDEHTPGRRPGLPARRLGRARPEALAVVREPHAHLAVGVDL